MEVPHFRVLHHSGTVSFIDFVRELTNGLSRSAVLIIPLRLALHLGNH